MAEKILTPEFRVSFPNVFRSQIPKEGGDPYWDIAMLFAKGEDLSKLKKGCELALKEKFGADRDKWPKKLQSPFRDQEEKEFEGYEPGAFFAKAKTWSKPGIVDQNRQTLIDEGELYPGCYAHATVVPKAYDTNGNKGVRFELHNIQKRRDGDPLGGRTRAEDDFEAIDSGGDDQGASGDDGADIFG